MTGLYHLLSQTQGMTVGFIDLGFFKPIQRWPDHCSMQSSKSCIEIRLLFCAQIISRYQGRLSLGLGVFFGSKSFEINIRLHGFTVEVTAKRRSTEPKV